MNNRKIRTPVIFQLLILLVTLAEVSSAQTAGTGAVTGTVTDAGGAVVAGASIKVTDVTTGDLSG